MRCRFAPSPTGLLHIGNARSAVLNWIYSKKNKGDFILRIDDTDLDRSNSKYEDKIKSNLNWLGLKWDSTFNQSHKIKNYQKKIEDLKEERKIYPCFETEEELALKRKSLLAAGKPPIYDRSSLELSQNEIKNKISNGINPHWRLKLDQKTISWHDLIKGKVSFDTKHLSDPVLIRNNGSLLYHLPSVIDDIDEGITDIIRGEDHISNTAYHIQIFEALKADIPNFAHHPFLTDIEGRGFSKRFDSLSIEKLIEDGFEHITILNYLVNIGSSKDIITEKNIDLIIDNFDIESISSSAAKFSYDILKSLNSNTLKLYNYEEIADRLKITLTSFSNKEYWKFIKNNIDFFSEVKLWEELIEKNHNLKNLNINDKIIEAAVSSLPLDPFDEDTWEIWTNDIKKKTGFVGKDLFMPLRLILTGKEKGPELKYLLPLFNKQTILRKFGKV